MTERVEFRVEDAAAFLEQGAGEAMGVAAAGLLGFPPRTVEAVLEVRRQAQAKGSYTPPAEVTAKARSRSPLFVRFGLSPEGGRSTKHHRRGSLEPGVCVFRARREGGALILDVSESPVVLAEFHIFSNAGRPAFYATGEEVGFGSGGEPCLRNPRLEPVEEGTRIVVSGEWGGGGLWTLLGPVSGYCIGVLDRHPDYAEARPFAERVEERVDGLLRAWGHEDVADERRRAREQAKRKPRPTRTTRRPRPVPPDPWESWQAQVRKWDQYGKGSTWT